PSMSPADTRSMSEFACWLRVSSISEFAMMSATSLCLRSRPALLDALKNLLDLFFQHCSSEGFDDVAVHTGLSRCHDLVTLCLCSYHQHWQRLQVFVCSNMGKQFDACHAWHIPVS